MTQMTLDELVQAGEDALEHYGVKGMKWGVRTKRTQAIKEARASNRASRALIRDSSNKVEKAALKKDYKQDVNRYAGRMRTTGEKFVSRFLVGAGALTLSAMAADAALDSTAQAFDINPETGKYNDPGVQARVDLWRAENPA